MNPTPHAYEQAIAILRAAERPTLLLGPEARPGLELWLRIADLLGAVVLTTPDALSLVGAERCTGTFSFGASDEAVEAAECTDAVLAVTGLSEFTNRLGRAFSKARVVQVTPRATDIGRNTDPALALLGSVETLAGELLHRLRMRQRGAACRWFHPTTPRRKPESLPAARRDFIHPEAAVDALQAALPDPARLCLDVTSGSLHVTRRIELSSTQRAFYSIEHSACMGEALMASLGIRVASGLPTLALVGDWCYAMAPSELHSAVEQGLDQYVVLVWSNGGGALVGTGVRQQGIAVSEHAFRWSSPPRFAKLACALNARATRVTSARSLARALKRAFEAPGPVLIEACIDPTVQVPAGDRFLTLGSERP